jgi:hypothetical protein
MKLNEIVYVLANPAMPGLVKIGKTTQADVSLRMNQLYTTGVPVPFECVYAIEVSDCTKVETALHVAFSPNRINPNREFFKIDSEQAIAILKLLEQKDVTPQVRSELNSNVSQAEKDSGKKLKKRPRMNFTEMGIQPNSELLFKDASTTVVIIDDRKVTFENEIMTLTAATKKIMDLDYSVQPSPYWTFKGKLLKDIYDETYNNEENN